MNTFELRLFSLQQSKILRIDARDEVDPFVIELLGNFAYQIDEEKRKISIESLQMNTSTLRERISAFVDYHKASVPQINQLLTFVKQLSEGEYFYIFPNTELDSLQIMELSNRLVALNKGKDLKLLQDEFASVFGDILSNYNLLSFNGESRAYIGERDKSKAVCRFCGKSRPATNFASKSHAISEALGNKGIVCCDECDACNAKFGSGIETDLIAFLSVHRAFFGIKGKGPGAPKLQGRNFSVHKDASGAVHFDVIGDEAGFPEHIEAHTYQKITPQNVYRALCKFVISVIGSDQLPHLKQCIDWINRDASIERLPAVAMQLFPAFYSPFPNLSVYTRKTVDENLPHIVGEFRFASIVIVFVLPSSSLDHLDFVAESELSKFWSISQYSKGSVSSGWSWMRLNSDRASELHFSIKFEKSPTPSAE